MLSEIFLQITWRLSVPSASTACAVFNVHCSGGLAALTLEVVLVLAVANAAAAKRPAMLYHLHQLFHKQALSCFAELPW